MIDILPTIDFANLPIHSVLAAATGGTIDTSLIGKFENAINPMFAAANAYADKLKPMGMVFLGVAFALEMMMMTFAYWMKGGAQDFMAGLVRLLILTSIPFALLSSWPELPNHITTFFQTELTSVFTGADGQSVSHQVGTALTKILDAGMSVVNNAGSGMDQPDPATTQAAAGGTWSKIWGAMETTYHPSWNPLIFLSRIIASMAMLVVVTLLGVALTFAMFGPFLMLKLGVIFGPILVPWLVFKPMSDLAGRWFSFMLTMGLAFAVGICLASIAATGMEGVAAAMASATNTSDALAALASVVPMMICLLFIAFVIPKCEHIAAAMIGGPKLDTGGAFAAFAGGMAVRQMMSSLTNRDKNKADAGGAPGDGAGEKGGASSSAAAAPTSPAGISASAAKAGATSQAADVPTASLPPVLAPLVGDLASRGIDTSQRAANPPTDRKTQTPFPKTDRYGDRPGQKPVVDDVPPVKDVTGEAAVDDATAPANDPTHFDAKAAGKGPESANDDPETSSTVEDPAQSIPMAAAGGARATESMTGPGSASPEDAAANQKAATERGAAFSASFKEKMSAFAEKAPGAAWGVAKRVASHPVTRYAALSSAVMMGGGAVAVGAAAAWGMSGKVRSGTFKAAEGSAGAMKWAAKKVFSRAPASDGGDTGATPRPRGNTPDGSGRK